MKRTPKIKIDYTGWTVEQHEEHLRTHPPYLAEYEKYNHFKEKVILKAQGDLGNCTDIAFTIEEHKQGRKVSGITFFIYSNPTNRSEEQKKKQKILRN